MQACQIFSDADDVGYRLGQLSTSLEAFREAINQGHLHRVRLTPNHPLIFPGLEMWGWIVGSLRDQLRGLGWVAHEKATYPVTVHPYLNLAISVASGDANVGNPFASPSTRSKKGKHTVEAVEQNCQLDMFADLMPEPSHYSENEGYDTWVLLHHTDHLKNEIRFELSRPSSIDKSGKINAWFERILLGSIDLDDDFAVITPPGGPDIEIDIRRKNA
ncbi:MULTISPECIES: hypothetical protein [Pseudomonas]|uniref:hypothetical protein n=1 Tax=Pseudomonas TaxID=286 RepID=UPI00084D6583|nr:MULTISPECIES: hypothetical protein [Pseudomonas]NMX33148.1 hypothetical protein [Pseudomonas sp. WS 5413]SFB46892.1 hypothetical protein SAMN05216248_10787 [Pseudomonas simiae]